MITQAAFADALEKNPTVHVNGRFMSDSSRTQALEIGVRHLNSSQRVASLSTQPYCIRISLASWGAECTVTSSRTAHFLSEQLPVSVLKFLQIYGNLSNGPPLIRHTIRRAKALTIVPKGE